MTYLQIALRRFPGCMINGCSGRFVAHDCEIWLCESLSDATARALFWNTPVIDLEPAYIPSIKDDNDADTRRWERRLKVKGV